MNFKKILMYLFGYLLIILANISLAFQSYIATIFVISSIYCIIGFLWKFEKKIILLPMLFHYLTIIVMFIYRSSFDFKHNIDILLIFFLLPPILFLILNYNKAEKHRYYILFFVFLTCNLISLSFYPKNSFNSSLKSDSSITIKNLEDKLKTNLLSLKDSTNFTLKIHNKIIVFDFWFANCEPCDKLMPVYENLYDHYKNDSSILFLSINNGKIDSYGKAFQKIKDKENKSLFYQDKTSNLITELNIRGYPEIIILNKQGEISLRKSGFNFDERFVFVNQFINIIDKMKENE